MLSPAQLLSRLLLLSFLLLSFACDSFYDGGREPGSDPELGEVPEPASEILLLREILGPKGVLPGLNAIILRDGRIVDVTTRVAALQYRGAKTRISEYPGGRALPGLCDAHGHLAGLGKSLETVNLRGARSYDELLRRCEAAAAQLPEGAWLEGRGWDQNLWPEQRMPTHDRLSERFPRRPVWLRRIDGHAGLANAEAMRRAGIGAKTPAPEGGRILHKAGGEPSGVFVDHAMSLISRQLPRVDARALERRLLLAQQHCFELGITRVHDAGVGFAQKRILEELERQGRWKLGVYAMWGAPGYGREPLAVSDPGVRARLRYRAVKLYADGALGSRGAALLSEYSDEPGNLGLLTLKREELARIVRRCAALGLQPCVHAIGDRANRMVLDVYEQELTAEQRAALRPRIEHAQVLSLQDLPRFARLGVLASMQPTHLSSDMPWAPTRLGAERVKGAYAFRTLLEAGVHVPFGSDFPVEPASIFDGLFAAMTTCSPRKPRGPALRPDQQLDPGRALAGFTSEAAYAAHEEGVRGRIAKGYEGDLTIVDRNLFAVRPGAILGTQVLATYVGGERVYVEGEGEAR